MGPMLLCIMLNLKRSNKSVVDTFVKTERVFAPFYDGVEKEENSITKKGPLHLFNAEDLVFQPFHVLSLSFPEDPSYS